MLTPVQFGGTQLILQSKTLTAVDDYAKQVEVIRKRIRGNMEVLGYDREVSEAIQRELPNPPDGQALWKVAAQKNETFLEQKRAANAADPNYRALLFPVGNLPNPLRPDERAYQAILVDGEDVNSLAKAVFEEAFFKKPLYQNGVLAGQGTNPVKQVEGNTPGNMDNELSRVKGRLVNECRTQYAQGQTDKILDLDA